MDYYELLGVSQNASQDELKKAYRRLAREHHPDANDGDSASEERFKEISHAYATLSDAEKRRRYDMFGPDNGPGRGPGPGAGAQGSAGFGVGIDDIFSAFFGGQSPFGGAASRGAAAPPSGGDIGVECFLEFEEAVFGADRDVEARVRVECETCDGSGVEAGTHAQTCTTCSGRGELQQVRRTMLGQVVTAHVCPACRGQGKTISHPCPACRGDGRVVEVVTMSVKIPAGIDDGAQLRLAGRGDVGPRGGRRGDLYVQMRVALPPDGWSREGDDLRFDLDTPITTAALGGRLGFVTLEGEDVEIDIRPGTRHGATKKFRGKGAGRLGSNGRGDLYVDIAIETPTNLDGEQSELLNRLAELRGENIDTSTMMGKIKQAFR